jgi:photosystem II stability/assembly factor-like uncharacterized protein/DNA-binding beta-propeller fold protein YncE
MKRLFAFSLILFLLVACSNAKPIPSISPSPVPTVAPSLIPSVTPSPAPSPTPDTSNWLPALDQTIDVGAVDLNNTYLQHPIAIDAQHDRVYVTTSVSRTLILDAKSFKQIEEINVGGELSLSADRLYIGVPGAYDSSGQQISTSELRAYDLQTLKLLPHVSYSDTSWLPAQVLVNEASQKVYVVRRGVYEIDPATLRVIGSISGTVPIEYGLVPNYSAVDAAIDPVHHRLIVSLNNGVPGSNGGNVLSIYDLGKDTLIANDGQRSVQSIDVDPASGVAVVMRAYIDTRSLVSYDQNGKPLHRLEGLTGLVQIDAAHQRVYVFEQYPRARLLVLDSDLNYQGEIRFAGIETVDAFRYDAQADRLLMLSRAGKLFVLKGHGEPPARPSPAGAGEGAVGSIQWMVASPNYAIDHKLFAAFAVGDYVGGAGALFSTVDEGKTWQAISGLPMSDTISSLAFSANYQTDQTVLVALGSSVIVPSNGSGIYRSTDAGRSWSNASRGLTDLSIKQISVADQKTIFAVGAKRGLFRSVDGGQTWTALADHYMNKFTYPNPILGALAVSPDFAKSKTLIISGQSGSLLTSHDSGETWTLTTANGAVQIRYLSPGQVLAAMQNGNVLRSDDNGDHWFSAGAGLDLQRGGVSTLAGWRDRATLLLSEYGQRGWLFDWSGTNQRWDQIQIDQPITITAVSWIEEANANLKLLIGTTSGQLISIAASDLKRLPPAALSITGKAIQAIVTPDGRQVFIGGGSFGVWKSIDGGATWQDTGFPDRDTSHSMQLILSPNYAQEATLFGATGDAVYRSRDGGQTWDLLKIPSKTEFSIGALAISPNFASDQAILIGGDYRSPELYPSNDGGETFAVIRSSVVTTPTGFTKLVMAADGAWYVWLDYTGLFRSDDQGQSWLQVRSDDQAVAQSLASDPSGAIWIGQLYGSVWRSLDRGGAWEPIGLQTFAQHVWISALAFSPEYAIDRSLLIGTDNGLFRSTDGGARWGRSDDGLPIENDLPLGIVALSISPNFQTDRTVYASITSGGLFVSQDGGQHWLAAAP